MTVTPEMIYMSDILLPRDPVSGKHAATKDYVDSQVTSSALVAHTHIASQITDLGTAATANTGTASGNVPVLDANGKLVTSVLPALAISNTYVVATQSAMLALTAQTGDIAVRTDLKKSYILAGNSPSTMSNWQELLTPTDAVTSVNGKTGVVVLNAQDVGALTASDLAAQKYRTTITGNGTDTEFDITHNLNTKEVSVQVFATSTMNPVQVAFLPKTVNIVTLSFALAPATGANGGNFIVIVRK